MWCHLLLLVPLVIVGLFILLPWPIALPIALAVAALTGAVMQAGARALRQPPVTGAASLIGSVAVTVTNLDPDGLVRIEGELWHGDSPEPVAKGQQVQVDAVEGLTVRVKAYPRQDGGHGNGDTTEPAGSEAGAH